MPCSDDGPSWQDIQREQERINVMAKLACAHCKELEARGEPIPEWAAAWWREHQIADREREARERAEAEAQRLRQNALSKLTPKELQALGIKD